MAILKISEAEELLQMAKAQAERINAVNDLPSLPGQDEWQPLLLKAATAVVNSLSESFAPFQTESFAKNFLVIARGMNSEVRALLHQYREQEWLPLQIHRALCEKNEALAAKIKAVICRLQEDGKKVRQPGKEILR